MPLYGFRCECGRTEEHYFSVREEKPTVACGECKGIMERDLLVEARNHRPSTVFPMTTTHINGKPMTFNSDAELQRACKEYGVAHRPDAAFLTKEYAGIDWRTGRQTYKESSGVGMPNCWV